MSRKDVITLGSLCTALVSLELLPDRRQPKSDMEDLREVLSQFDQGQVAALLAQAKCRLCPELSPVKVYAAYGLLEDGQ